MDEQLTPVVTLTQLASPEEVFKSFKDQIVPSVLGYAGYATREMMKKNSKLSQHPSLQNSLTQRISKSKNTVYIRSYVDGATFGAYGHALASQAVILSKYQQLISKGKTGVEGVYDRLNGRKTSGMLGADERTYGSSAAKKFGEDNFDKLRIQTGTRINSKGKVVPKYKTVYTLKGSSSLNNIGLLHYKLPNGDWARSYGVQIATRPESLFWVNWIQTWGQQAFFDSTTQQALNTYLGHQVDKMMQEATK